jgi:hypothetical protein
VRKGNHFISKISGYLSSEIIPITIDKGLKKIKNEQYYGVRPSIPNRGAEAHKGAVRRC